jgi:hypothetical protein
MSTPTKEQREPRILRILPRRSMVGRPARCVCRINPGNSARAFSHPALSVSKAAQMGLIANASSYLEIGAGNLRNARFASKLLRASKMTVVERVDVIERFASNYDAFTSAGGTVLDNIPKGRFDLIVATYVFETICPPRARDALLRQLVDRMKCGSHLVSSLRGYPGVRGRRYRQCRRSDGFRSPSGAFVRAFSLSEANEFFSRNGLRFASLEKYRSERPENIHAIGRI